MTVDFAARFPKSPVGPAAFVVKPASTNESLIEAWSGYTAKRLQSRVFVSYRSNVDRYVLSLSGKPVRQSDEQHVWRFIQEQLAICSRLRSNNAPSSKGWYCEADCFPFATEPPSSCNHKCPFYSSRNPLVIQHALKALNSFHSFLARMKVIPENFLPDVIRDFSTDFPQEKYLKSRRKLKPNEVRLLIQGTADPIRKALFGLLAKSGFRVYEIELLTTDPDCIDFENKVIRIPVPAEGRPNKRRGKRLTFIDSELERLLLGYLNVRATLLQRRPSHTHPKAFFVGSTGRPLKARTMEAWLRADAIRLGLVSDWRSHTNRLTCHSFRHLFTGVLLQKKCPEIYVKHLRGDVIGDVLGDYHDPSDDELKQVYFEFFPLLGI